MRNGWRRVTKARPCPVCGKPDWCCVTRDETAAICPRTSDGAVRYLDGSGYLHRLNPVGFDPKPVRPARSLRPEPTRVYDWGALAKWFAQQAVGRTAWLAIRLGVSEASLNRLDVGKSSETAWTFPMRNDAGSAVGIRIRYESGVKRAVSGSRSGLFVPSGLNGGTVYVCEGPTDTAAMLSLGLSAVGRASCTEGAKELRPMTAGRNVVIVADGDKPGRDGAARLAKALDGAVSVRVIVPPDGVKDAREWVNRGATKTEVEATR